MNLDLKVNKTMASATGVRVVFFGSHKRPSYVVETYTVPEIKNLSEGEVLIKILMTTICPMDLDHIDGRKEVVLPCVLGHEGVGEVVFSQPNRYGSPMLQAGDRVVFTTVSKCGCYCSRKSEKQESGAVNMKFGGSSLKDRHLNGCYSSHMVLKASAQVVPVPSNVPDEAACLANCALATMVHAVSCLSKRTTSTHSVAIVQGANLRGLFACALLNNAGFEHVYCHDMIPEKLKLVPKFSGIPVLVNKDCGDCNSACVDSDPENVDVIIDVCGRWDVVSHGLSVLKPHGTYIFVGTSHEEHTASIDIDTVIKKCITVKGIQGYSANHLEEAVQFLSATNDRFPYGKLMSPPVLLQDFHKAVSMARSNWFYRTAIRSQVSQTT